MCVCVCVSVYKVRQDSTPKQASACVRACPSGNGKLLCSALLQGPADKAQTMLHTLAESAKSFNAVSTIPAEPGKLGWEEFAPVHAACLTTKVASVHTFLEFIIGKGADLSLWGKRLSVKTSYAKRLPLHYAAENKTMKADTVMMVARAYPKALFEPVNGVPGRALPCQCSKHNPETQQALEKLMYEYICEACDGMKAAADLFRLMRLAIEFEVVRTIPTEDLPRGKVTALVSPLILKVRENLHGSAEVNFAGEAAAFAAANPRVDLGRETENKVQVKSINTMGEAWHTGSPELDFTPP